MDQDESAFPHCKYLLLLLETVGLSLQAPALPDATFQWPSRQIQRAAGTGLASGHAQLRSGHQSGDNMGQGSKLKLQDQADTGSARLPQCHATCDPSLS